MASLPDYDPQETQEWLDALESVLKNEGAERAQFLLGQLIDKARNSGAAMPFSATTPYCNTIPVGEEQRSTGNQDLEHRIRAWMRWNAMVLVLNANRDSSELGGHIASFASAALCTTWDSIIFFTARPPRMAAIWCISRGIHRPAFMPALSSKGVSARSRCTSSARKRKAAACLLIRIRG